MSLLQNFEFYSAMTLNYICFALSFNFTLGESTITLVYCNKFVYTTILAARRLVSARRRKRYMIYHHHHHHHPSFTYSSTQFHYCYYHHQRHYDIIYVNRNHLADISDLPPPWFLNTQYTQGAAPSPTVLHPSSSVSK